MQGPSSARPAFRPPRPAQQDLSNVSPARLEAARILYRVEQGEKVSEVLEAPNRLSTLDQGLMRELVYGCTRQKRLLDHYLQALTEHPFVKLPVEAKIALRMGLYQLLFLDRVPAHAAVFESVNLAKKGGQEKLAGFVNAVLRAGETKKAGLEAKGDSDIDTLALKYSHPTWLVKRWQETYGPEQLEGLLQADNQPHEVYLRVKPGQGAQVAERLSKEGVRTQSETWPADTLRIAGHEGGLFAGESFKSGEWVVQDWTPQAMLELLPLKDGDKAWDVCAAPGGKTVGLSWKVGDSGQVMATDASEPRRKKLLENLKRTGLRNVRVYEEDIRKLTPSQKFDLVWVDAPCSGTGVLSRRADLRWRLIPKDVTANTEVQRQLLEESARHLYPKGLLVYSTCSLEKEENADVVLDFLNRHPEFKPALPSVPQGYPEILSGNVGLTFLPLNGHDGGFLSVMVRS